jgi:peptidoglycan/xylan/chitin deacetylase (PgdA/CDA1 family)
VAAASATAVSLTFDNGASSQYTLGYQQALQPARVPATFYVNSGTIGVSAKFLSWAQLSSLAGAGDEIGGKTVDGTNLTTLTAAQQVNEICTDRQNIMAHGITPFSFAYPNGASTAAIQSEVQNCGYGNARTAGGLAPGGAAYAETLPPKSWLGLRAWAPTGQATLANLESIVTGAAGHGGGLVPLVLQKVCSATLDAANYSTCTASSGWVDLSDLQAFIEWVQDAGQSAGAPAGVSFQTVGNAAKSADNVAPVTTSACNGTTCQTSTYVGTVQVSLLASDLGSGVASTHYTTDGSTPTLSSPTYNGSVAMTSSGTIEYRSWDNAGNVEAVHTVSLSVQQQSDSTPPSTTMTCNGSPCGSGTFYKPVTVALNATDNPGGWGVANTYYTLDGSTPTTSSTVYTGPFTLHAPATVKFFSTDLAGNVEQLDTQPIQVTTVVSLTFDDAYQNQWLYAVPLLQQNNMNATFYAITSDDDGPYPCCMSWAQLRTLQGQGDDIGAHTIDHPDLTQVSQSQAVWETCGARQDMLNNGIQDPESFAYPFGTYNAAAESVVAQCGFTNARQGGGVSNSNVTPGSPWLETLPPKDPEAVRTIAVDGASPMQLSDLENFVTAAAAHGGGWLPITLHNVCDANASDYASCMASYGPVQDTVLAQFLSWLHNAGQPGGAPASVDVETMRWAMNSVNGVPSTPPATTAMCDGNPCQGTYGGSVSVSLSSNDTGATGVRTIYYTTDGSTPTTASHVYTTPLILLHSTTVKYYAVDNAGNAEPVDSTTVAVGANPTPVIAAAADIACDPTQPNFNAGNGTNTECRELGTSKLLIGADAVLAMGDEQYGCGGYEDYLQSYDPTWGWFKSITYPVPGDHDLDTTGGSNCPSTPGAGYQQYFSTPVGTSGAAVPSAVNTDPSTGYYSFNLGTWHIIALNTGACENTPSFCAAGGAQDQWLQNDLAHDTAACTLAFGQVPRWASNGNNGWSWTQAMWQDLYNAGADVMLGGHAHWYERFQPLDASGNPDPSHGVTEFIVGTGGQGLDTPGTQLPTSAVLSNSGHGVLRLTLGMNSYSWKYLSDTDGTTTDSGTAQCHSRP